MSAEKKLAAIDPEPEKDTPESTETDSKPEEKSVEPADKASEAEPPTKDEEEGKESAKKDSDDAPPPMPTRPSKPLSQTDITIAKLVDVFPHLDPKYIKMALIASEGRLEPASNALLFLSDPDSGIEIPQPNASTIAATRSKGPSLEESDEALARRLAKAYERGSRRASSGASSKVRSRTRPSQDGDISNNQIRRTPSMSEHHVYNNYIDDRDYDNEEDLYDTITKNVNDAKQVVGSWFGSVAKKIQESIDQPQEGQRPPVPSRRQNPVSYSRSPYQQPQSIHRGYYSQKNEYVVNDNEDDDAPTLPARHRGPGPLYPAVGGGPSDAETPVEIRMTDHDSNELEETPKPIEKDELYTTNSAKITMNKKSEPTTATTTTNTNAAPASSTSSTSENKTWTPLKSVDPEPSSDAFLVDDSEDDEDKE